MKVLIGIILAATTIKAQAQSKEIPVYSNDGVEMSLKIETQQDGSHNVDYNGLLYAGCGGSCMMQGYNIRLDKECKLLGFWKGEKQIDCDMGVAPSVEGLGDLMAKFDAPAKDAGPELQRLSITFEGVKALKELQKNFAEKKLSKEQAESLGLLKPSELVDEKGNPNWAAFDANKLVRNMYEKRPHDDLRLDSKSVKHEPLAPEEIVRIVEYANDPAQLKSIHALIPDENKTNDNPTHGYAARMSQAMRDKGPAGRKLNISGAGNSVTTFFVHLSMIRKNLGCKNFPLYEGPKLPAQASN